MNPSIARVAVFTPLRQLFDYLLPATVAIQPGMRVIVPFGNTERIGIVTAIVSTSDLRPEQLKPLQQALDNEPLLRPQDIEFLLWIAEYYQHPSGDVFAAALPLLLRNGGPVPHNDIAGWRLTRQGAAFQAETLSRAPKQAALLSCLQQQASTELSHSHLLQLSGSTISALKGLQQRGLIEPCRLSGEAPQVQSLPEPAPPLSAEQSEAVAVVLGHSGFGVFLLEGITGSGKTEVYLTLAREAIGRGRQVLVLVPEISLTPQTTKRFQQRLGLIPAVLHSGLNDRERALTWDEARSGEALLVLGTRSAVLTPLPGLGLVIVDEEHDLSFKQQDGFRYSARDLAVMRGHRSQCPVVLGSATPSLESLHKAENGRYQRLRLTQRASGASSPTMHLLDIRSAPLQAGLSRPLLHEMETALERGEQVLLFLNRRGFAPVLTCHDCGWTSQCRHCDARMTVHRADSRICCHHCGFSQRLPIDCPECKGTQLVTAGQGTQQLESFLNQRFPTYSTARIDRDSTRRRGELDKLLTEIQQGRHQILLGTQMLAKGHDFPNVTLVGIVDVDQGLFGADFRATERMAQLLIQVAGRAGRAEKPGRVVIQSRHADHPHLLTLIGQGYRAFATEMLSERAAAHLPPFGYQILLRADSRQKGEAEAFLERALLAARHESPPQLQFWGPAPAPMEKRAGRLRQQLLVQCDSRPLLHQFLARWLIRLESIKSSKGLRWAVDVDPQEML